MTELTEETLAPDVVVRRSSTTRLDIEPGTAGRSSSVGVTQGTVWARAERSSAGVVLRYGVLDVVVHHGTVLVDTRSGAGLVIVVRGQVTISAGGATVGAAHAGQALAIDVSGTISGPKTIDPAELAGDDFVSLNLVLDSLGGVPVGVDDDGTGPETRGAPPAAPDDGGVPPQRADPDARRPTHPAPPSPHLSAPAAETSKAEAAEGETSKNGASRGETSEAGARRPRRFTGRKR